MSRVIDGCSLIILSVHNSADIYGASRTLLRMLGPFSEDGHTVHVVLPQQGPLVELLSERGVTVHVFEPLAIIDREEFRSLRGKLSFIVRYLRSIYWLSKLMIRLRVDLVHTNVAVIPAPALAAWLTGRKHLWHIREFFSEFRAIWQIYQRYIWILSSRILTISNAVRDQFSPSLRSKCVVIYDGLPGEAMAVDLDIVRDFRSKLGNPDFLVGVVGRIKWVRKGQEVLIKAAALLANRFPDVRYVIVGSAARGNEEHLYRLQELIKESNLDRQVMFTGDVDEPREMYGAFDITVVPSVLPEPFGCVVMESMAAGTPVIGSNCGGIPEQIVDGSTGMLFEPGDERDLARVLAHLMDNREELSRMARTGQEHFKDYFSIEDAHQKFTKAFTNLP